jgi:hypothetical protein
MDHIQIKVERIPKDRRKRPVNTLVIQVYFSIKVADVLLSRWPPSSPLPGRYDFISGFPVA